MNARIRLAHVITGLDVGGAEQMLVSLLSHLDRTRFEPLVISLTDKGDLGEEITSLGVPVQALGIRRRPRDMAAVFRLAGQLRRARPDVLQTWMYVADLIGGVVGRLQGVPVIWGVHQSKIDKEGDSWATHLSARTNGLLSRVVPAKIVCVSEDAADQNRRIGFSSKRIVVIPNGVDIDKFRPDDVARRAVRDELGIAEDDVLVGLVARFNPLKDHAGFLLAAREVVRSRPQAKFAMCGAQVVPSNSALMQHITGTELEGRIQLLGTRRDMPKFTAALDVAVSSSRSGESFSIALAEALACGVPCVTTRTGFPAQLVEGAGLVVPPGDPQALARAMMSLIDHGPEERERLGREGRSRIERDFSLPSVARKYERLYEEVVISSKRKRRTS